MKNFINHFHLSRLVRGINLGGEIIFDIRDERDFGFETETETRGVSRPVSRFETTCQKSQYQSQNLRLISKVSVSV